MDDNQKRKPGRPALTDKDLDEIFHKLDPYLRAGLSVNKACLQAQVPTSTVYKFMKEDPEFMEKIQRSQQFIVIVLTNALVRELHAIIEKQTTKDEKGRSIPLDREDRAFLWNFALKSNLMREEFGERQDIGVFDPEVEIQRISALIDRRFGEKKEDGPSKC